MAVLTGNNSNNTIVGTADDDTIYGRDGSDTLSGGFYGYDSIVGGSGNDVLLLENYDGKDGFFGGGGDDVFQASGPFCVTSGSTLDGGAGNDVLLWDGKSDLSDAVLVGIEELRSAPGTPGLYDFGAITSSQLSAFIRISSYSDSHARGFVKVSDGGAVRLNLTNSLSDFVFVGSSSSNHVTVSEEFLGLLIANLGDGGDSAVAPIAGSEIDGEAGNDTLTGNIGSDRLSGGSGANLMFGGGGEDVLVASGHDQAYGGEGNDAIVLKSGAPIMVSGDSGIDTLIVDGDGYNAVDISSVSIAGVEIILLGNHVYLSLDQLSAISVVGAFGGNAISMQFTSGGQASLDIQADVKFVSVAGSDGNDSLSLNALGGAQIEALMGRGNDSIAGSVGSDNISGGAGNDTVYGGLGYDRLYGDMGVDQIFGGDGNDSLYGDGLDTLNGGEGADLLFVGSDAYGVIEGAAGRDTLEVASGRDISQAQISSVEVLRVSSWAKITPAQLREFSVVEAAGGLNYASVTLTEGGSATVRVGVTVSFGFGISGSIESDRITISSSYSGVIEFRGDRGSDLISSGRGSDSLFGDQGADTLTGNGGDDYLAGGEGPDRLVGGFGRDTLSGGLGADTFVYRSLDESEIGSPDTITEFDRPGARKGDLIDLSAIDANATTSGANEAFQFGSVSIGGVSAIDQGSDTLIRLNTDSDSDFEMFILISDGDVLASAYTASDFVL